MGHRAGHAILRMRLAATAPKVSGISPGMMSCPSFQRAFSHCPALGSLGATPHNSSAAGHRPNGNVFRGLGRRVRPGKAPVEAAVAELIDGTERGSRAAASCASWLMA